MRVRYYPLGVGAFVGLGLLALYVVKSAPEAENENVEIPDRFVEMLADKEAKPAPQANPDAGEGARAKREEGKVALKKTELDRAIAENAGTLGALRDAGSLDGQFAGNGMSSGGIGGLIGTKGTQIGAGGLGHRGSGIGGGGTAEGLGGLGTKGIGSGRSGYGMGGGSFAAKRYSPPPRVNVAPLSKDWDHVGHNPTELAERDYLSTFSIDVDTASYTQARRQIQSGRTIPNPASVRTEEFVNFFRYDYPEPERGRPFSVTMDGAEHPWQTGHHLLRVGIKGAEDHDRARLPVHLTFLVDVSGSMRSADKLPLAKEALVHLVGNLEEGDTVAIATYAGSNRVILEPTDASRKDTIVGAIYGLQNGGGTAMASGMQLAYDMAERSLVKGEENRVIVLSDGDANIGASSHESILKGIEGYAKKGITLSTVGFGTGNYRDALMEQLADKGDGNYAYVDSLKEAKRVFGEDLGATLRTIARDVKIQVEFNRDNVIAYKLVGYENREIADEDFRNDKVDAGEVGAGHTVTALYDVVLRDNRKGSLATVRVRHKEPGPDVPAKETAVDLPARAVNAVFEAGSKDLRRAWGTAAFAEKLRGAKEMEEVSWEQIASVVRTARRSGDERDTELLGLIERVSEMTSYLEEHQEVAAATGPLDPIILGAVDRGAIESVIARHRNQIRYCYQRELTKNPSLAGKMTMKFVIAKDGNVSSAKVKTSSLGNQAVESCVSGRFMRMQFPQPQGGGIAIVNYPFSFTNS